MRRIIIATAAAAACLALTACATGAPMSDPSPSRPAFQTTTPGAIAPTGTPAEVPPARWSAIEADLAERGVDGIPELVSAEQIVFADGSLGCPSPGQAYTQAQVEGMRVVVEAAGTTYDYRFGTGDSVKLCTR